MCGYANIVHLCNWHMTFAGSQDDSGTSEVMKLKRRFLRDASVEGSYFAKFQLKKRLALKVIVIVCKHLSSDNLSCRIYVRNRKQPGVAELCCIGATEKGNSLISKSNILMSSDPYKH